ncbi:hypothetical protein Z043_106320 [Scleropages formosus]|uniref:Uncharacterized protein n=1 Tax=Scleropages formosus TaxID=113540 RepID=A0A0P7UJL4_SCLFO|nr:hypothetical protein Z043_106320 [Scleropages formosus]
MFDSDAGQQWSSWFREKMPAGVSWPRYLRMLGASLLAMFAGAEVVHRYYRPDLVLLNHPFDLSIVVLRRDRCCGEKADPSHESVRTSKS